MEELIPTLIADYGPLGWIPVSFFTFSNWKTIRRELRPNGGESMHDRVSEIEETVVRLEERKE